MTEQTRPASIRRWGPALPLAIFAVLAGLFWYALQSGDPSLLPSPLIGKKVPDFTLPALEGLGSEGKQVPGFASADLAQGEPTLVNVFASWCVECQVEHPLLLALSQQPGIRLYGIDYKDDPVAARRFLGRYGNPFAAVGVDGDGRAAIEWGVYGMPETFVVDGKGRIAYKHVGPISSQTLETKIIPAIQAAQAR